MSQHRRHLRQMALLASIEASRAAQAEAQAQAQADVRAQAQARVDERRRHIDDVVASSKHVNRRQREGVSALVNSFNMKSSSEGARR